VSYSNKRKAALNEKRRARVQDALDSAIARKLVKALKSKGLNPADYRVEFFTQGDRRVAKLHKKSNPEAPKET